MPGPKARKDGYRPRIGGPDHRIRLTRGEYLILIEMFNQLADQRVSKRWRQLGNGERVSMEVKPFIAKLLKLGLRTGWTKVPPCFRQVH